MHTGTSGRALYSRGHPDAGQRASFPQGNAGSSAGCGCGSVQPRTFVAWKKTAQLILQVAGRAGRADHPGEVVLQTLHAEHPMLNTLVHAGYEAFASEELRLRHAGYLPPFSHHALIRAEANRQGLAESFLISLRELAQQQQLLPQGVQCIGPFPAVMEKRAGLFRAQMLMQSPHRPALQHALPLLTGLMQAHPEARRVRWSIGR